MKIFNKLGVVTHNETNDLADAISGLLQTHWRLVANDIDPVEIRALRDFLVSCIVSEYGVNLLLRAQQLRKLPEPADKQNET